MADYQLTFSTAVIRTRDGACIPDDPGNRDWREYQAWLADGGVPDPYVPPPEPPPPVPLAVAWSDEYSAGTTVAAELDAAAPSADQLAAGPPAKIAWNTPGQADATQVAISRLNGKNSDYSSVLASALQPGRLLRIEARADAEGVFTSHHITAVTRQGSSFIIDVTPFAHANTPFANNAALNLGVFA